MTEGGKQPVVEARGFRKRYGAQRAVDGLDLTIHAGEIFGLIGPDGAGKSSFMKAVAGVLQFDGGSLSVFGTAIDSDAAAESIKDRIGLMPQGLGQNLYPDLSIEENVDFFARLRLVPQAEAEARKERLFAITRLGKFRARPMKQLSGGMKQKLGLVCTLIHAPLLIVLDEPTTGVDPVSRRDFWAILAELLQETGATALVSTAYLDEASRFDRVLLLHEGRALAAGEPSSLSAAQSGTVLTLHDLQSDEALQLARQFGYLEPRGRDWRLFLAGLNAEAAQAAITTLLGRTVQTRASEPELEDAFIALVGAPPAAPPVVVAQAHGAEPVIEARHLTRRFGDFVAVDDANFRVLPGEVFGLLGANGAGKTTAIKMLNGILPPSSGEGWVAGADMKRAGRAIKARIGYMSQAFSLYTDLTAIENIQLYASIYGLSRQQARERARWIVDMAGLAGFEDALAASLPMGLRQRLALGCALVHSPRVLFLDEPTSGVDPLGRRRFWDILFRLAREEGVAVLVTTHYMSEAERCDKLALMFAGRVVAEGTPASLKQALAARRGKLLALEVEAPRQALVQLQSAGVDASLHGRRLHCFVADPAAEAPRLCQLLASAGLAARALGELPASMEDVFVALMTELEAT
ncbi:ATP-binding cassette domain-containing protein [Parachitinimonas caeni]|uniref:ATP-binding cassette domain-containing protein n=1 Tax=Parachitinimonas caeni TaxID=3031301 RepID=A0ABT7E3H6_9NEIS|nr:ATP-binding cassette domain-containing protein [Parachitinimonas caeni]MDK2126873.1 ATP-binding cassette domain-containing protein [Parachitinimonas caeni]